MTLEQGIEKLKGLIEKFKSSEPTEPIVTTEQSFKDVKLADGVTIISYDGETPMQGMPVYVITPDGRLPLPDGDYQLEDGTIISVSGGLIASVTEAAPLPEGETNSPAATAAPTTPQTGSMEQKSAPKRVIKSQVEEHVFHLEIEGIEPIKVDFSSMVKGLIEENKALKAFNKEMFGVVKQIAGEPSTTPTENTKKPFSIKDYKAEYRADLERLREQAQKNQ